MKGITREDVFLLHMDGGDVTRQAEQGRIADVLQYMLDEDMDDDGNYEGAIAIFDFIDAAAPQLIADPEHIEEYVKECLNTDAIREEFRAGIGPACVLLTQRALYVLTVAWYADGYDGEYTLGGNWTRFPLAYGFATGDVDVAALVIGWEGPMPVEIEGLTGEQFIVNLLGGGS